MKYVNLQLLIHSLSHVKLSFIQNGKTEHNIILIFSNQFKVIIEVNTALDIAHLIIKSYTGCHSHTKLNKRYLAILWNLNKVKKQQIFIFLTKKHKGYVLPNNKDFKLKN